MKYSCKSRHCNRANSRQVNDFVPTESPFFYEIFAQYLIVFLLCNEIHMLKVRFDVTNKTGLLLVAMCCKIETDGKISSGVIEDSVNVYHPLCLPVTATRMFFAPADVV